MMKNRRYVTGKQKSQNSFEALDFKWSAHSYTLDHITRNFRLPCAVRCHVGSCSVDWNLLHFDLSEPILLHSKRSIKKVKASILKLDPEKAELEVTGSHVVIPADYDGWFTKLNDPTEKYLPSKTLECIADKGTDQVLVANSISCLCLTDDDKGETNTERKLFSSGEVLHVKRTETKTIQSKYLVCADENDKEMYLPFSQNGKFYKVNKAFSDDGLFQIQHIVDNKEYFPLQIRHVIGDVPYFATEYSSYLQCYDVIEEDTAVASTMDDDLLLLELQIKTPLKFFIALNEASIKQTEYYSDALQNCESESEDYVRSIKFSFTLSPDSYSVSNSLQSFGDDSSSTESYYNDSEIGIEDADSEFTIKWDPSDDNDTIKRNKERHVPKIFNSSINTTKKSSENNGEQWNDLPETV